MDLDRVYASLFAVDAAAHPKQCYGYILSVIRHMAEENPGADWGARDLSDALRKRLRLDFGALAPQVLSHWGLKDGAELGAAVKALASQGCLQWGPGDKLEDYAAQGSLLSD